MSSIGVVNVVAAWCRIDLCPVSLVSWHHFLNAAGIKGKVSDQNLKENYLSR